MSLQMPEPDDRQPRLPAERSRFVVAELERLELLIDLDVGPELSGKGLGLLLGAMVRRKATQVFEHGVSEGADDRGLARRLGELVDIFEFPATRATVERRGRGR